MFDLLGTLFSSLFGFGSGLLEDDANVRAQKLANDANLQMNKETNETNIQLQQMANDANVRQAELSYQRSLPINQIRDLMNAGVSKSAAINKLTGGGVYAAPVMGAAQMQAGHVNPVMRDFSKMSEALQQLGNIPSNVLQYKQSQQSLDNLRQEYDLRAAEEKRRIAEEKRKQEIHEFDMWSRQYGKDNASALDNASNLVLNALLDSGKEISDFKSFESLIRDLGLSDKPILRSLPSAARSQLETSVRERFNESRAQQQQENANRAAEDAAKLSEYQRKKYAAELKQMREDYDESVRENKTRSKERVVREGVAKLQEILNERKISTEELRDSVLFDNDGKPTFINEQNTKLKEAWNFIGNVFGIGYLGDILRGMFAIAK